MKHGVLTKRPTLVDNTMPANAEQAALQKRQADMFGKAVVMQNTDGSGETAVGYDPVSGQIKVYKDGAWVVPGAASGSAAEAVTSILGRLSSLEEGASSLGTSGYKTYGDGFTLQWGYSNAAGDHTITFPVAFTAVYGVFTQAVDAVAAGWGHVPQVHDVTTTNFVGPGYSGDLTYYWWAIGKV